jgi:hypothetical protein
VCVHFIENGSGTVVGMTDDGCVVRVGSSMTIEFDPCLRRRLVDSEKTRREGGEKTEMVLVTLGTACVCALLSFMNDFTIRLWKRKESPIEITYERRCRSIWGLC